MLIKFCYPNQRYHKKGKMVGQTHAWDHRYLKQNIGQKIKERKKEKRQKKYMWYNVLWTS